MTKPKYKLGGVQADGGRRSGGQRLRSRLCSGSNGGFTSNNLRDYFANGTVLNSILSASYRPGSSFSGNMTENGATGSFTGTPISTLL